MTTAGSGSRSMRRSAGPAALGEQLDQALANRLARDTPGSPRPRAAVTISAVSALRRPRGSGPPRAAPRSLSSTPSVKLAASSAPSALRLRDSRLAGASRTRRARRLASTSGSPRRQAEVERPCARSPRHRRRKLRPPAPLRRVRPRRRGSVRRRTRRLRRRLRGELGRSSSGRGQLARDDLGDAVAAHADAVEDVGGVHGPLLVGDDDELGALGEAADQAQEAVDVDVVERRLDLVEDVEGARAAPSARRTRRRARPATSRRRRAARGGGWTCRPG